MEEANILYLQLVIENLDIKIMCAVLLDTVIAGCAYSYIPENNNN